MKKLVFVLIIVLVSCSTGDSEKDAFDGEWTAQWDTDPTGYGELADGMSFTMNGKFSFDNEEVTISAFGYDGCIFGSDTLSHTQAWALRSDTLELQNQPGEPGIQYKILEQSEEKIRLQLVEDIFVTLTKE